MNERKKAIFYAVLAAALYALNSPLSKIFLENISPTLMAGLLYLGAGFGMFILEKIRKLTGAKQKELPLTRKELPYTVAMVVLDIAAPICLMIGLKHTAAANVSLLNNFEIVATAVIALVIFKESVSKRLWAAIILVTAASILLSFEDASSLSFSWGSLSVLLACICWGLENNCTRMLSSKNPMEIVVIKGLFSGGGSVIISLLTGEALCDARYIFPAMLLGFVAYGLSIFFYIYAQRDLGAAETGTYYSIAPFIGAGLSLIIFRQAPSAIFIIALLIMLVGTFLAANDQKA